MKQPHTETAVTHTDGEQDTGNHRANGAPEKPPGGTRSGAGNVEKAADLDKAASRDRGVNDSSSVNGQT